MQKHKDIISSLLHDNLSVLNQSQKVKWSHSYFLPFECPCGTLHLY